MRNAIIVLNWNGWEDTLELLNTESMQTDSEHTVFIFDNNSSDDSVNKIREWLQKNAPFTEVDLDFFHGDQMLPLMRKDRYVLIKSDDNYGFAKPNNMVIRQALKAGYEYITLCNNDVILQQNTLSDMLSFMDTNIDYGCCSCKINFYDRKDTVWHVGGFFTFYGDVFPYSAGAIKRLVKKHGNIIPVGFIVGCFLMCRSSVYKEHGLLTEHFFFGEEDINFSARMNKAKVPMGINLSVVIYHKVNSSINKKGKGNPNYKNIIHFTNRMIDYSHNMNKIQFLFFRPFYLCMMIAYFTWRYKNPKRVLTIVGAVRRYSKNNSGVSRELFEKICRKYS